MNGRYGTDALNNFLLLHEVLEQVRPAALRICTAPLNMLRRMRWATFSPAAVRRKERRI